MIRPTRAVLALAATLALLTGCGGAEQPASSDALANVQVTGEVGAAPTVTIGDVSGLGADTVSQVVVAGDGPETTPDSFIDASMVVYDGASKQQVAPYAPLGQIFTPADAALPAYFSDIFVGVPSGSRVVAIIPGDLMLAGSGQPAPPGTEPPAPAVVVADIKALQGLAAWGEERPPSQDLVAVTDGEGGAPQITVAVGAEAPAELLIDTRKSGDGAVVAEGDTVTVQYTGVVFATGAEFDSSWTRGRPAQFATTDVVPGFAGAMVGQTVGSQVIAIIPPDLAYGDRDSGAIPAGSTLVFVIDILAAG